MDIWARAQVAMVGIALVVGACGGTTDTSGLSSTSVPTVPDRDPPATTIADPPRIEIPTDGLLKWDTGVHVASSFWTPGSFAPDDLGWWSLGATEIWVHLQLHETGESRFDLDVTLLAHAPSDPPETMVAGILTRAEVSTSGPPTATEVAGHRAITADLVLAASPLFGGTCEINQAPGNSRFPSNDAGIYLLTEVGGISQGPYGSGFGIRSCRAARIWAIDVDGDTILVIAATTGHDDFERLIPYADRLLAAMAFGG